MGKTYSKRGQDEKQSNGRQAGKGHKGLRDRRDPFDAMAFVDKRQLKKIARGF